ncbi:hypothetical protein INT45_005594 [Circinella minor]|uniref:Homeobox domain-containing protein n=2 Tax=Lichtheimiaceae TaxID=499202 RepID=A0A8H7VLT4_9FUNG|nr:hypothetical protein INT45_005594 [Circinella minor]
MSTETMQPFEQSFNVVNPSPNDVPAYYAAAAAAAAAAVAGPSSSESDSNYLLETFHQFPHGDFRPTFYNPFEIKHRRRTSRAQLKVLEKSFSENSKPNATVRRILAQKLDMTPRGVQIWFQNRRAKAKLQRRKQSANSEDQQEKQQQDQQDQQQYHYQQQGSPYSSDEYDNNNSSDMDQSALFSQFFANVHPQSGNSGKPAFTSYLPPNGQMSTSMKPHQQETPVWGSLPWQQQHQQGAHSDDNVRSVAAVAAAAAAAAASTSYETNTTFASAFGSQHNNINNNNNWLNVPVHPLNNSDEQPRLVISGDDSVSRRKSCPSNTSIQQQQQADQSCLLAAQYSLNVPQSWSDQSKERRWSENDVTSWDGTSNNNSCCNFSGCNDLRRDWSLEACSPLPDQISMDFYPLQDISLGYPSVPATAATNNTVAITTSMPSVVAQPQQYTPPLGSSCSASTVSTSVTGSPISMDGYYENNNTNNGGCFDCLTLQNPSTTTTTTSQPVQQSSSNASVAEAIFTSTFA